MFVSWQGLKERAESLSQSSEDSLGGGGEGRRDKTKVGGKARTGTPTGNTALIPRKVKARVKCPVVGYSRYLSGNGDVCR